MRQKESIKITAVICLKVPETNADALHMYSYESIKRIITGNGVCSVGWQEVHDFFAKATHPPRTPSFT